MMDWKTPLGLLGLLAIAVLILIYILKPNYQQKVISSTYVWRLSEKYRKKDIPISRFRNIIIFICQVLILTIGAVILAQPFFVAPAEPEIIEHIVIIDASASMLATQSYDGKEITRFERAVIEVRKLGQDAIDKHGKITLILAETPARFAGPQRMDSLEALNEELDKLAHINALSDTPIPAGCTYGHADVDGAMLLAESILNEEPEATVFFYSAKKYDDAGDVKLISVASPVDKNTAILNVVPVLDVDGYYYFDIDVVNYDISPDTEEDINVRVTAYGTNELKETISRTVPIERCRSNQIVTARIDLRIVSYDKVYFKLEAEDSFEYDNEFYIFGGLKPTVRVLYQRPKASIFTNSVVAKLTEILAPRYELEFKDGMLDKEAEYEGYDFYIFEHEMPDVLPEDGIVLLIDPDIAPENSGIELGDPIGDGTKDELLLFSLGQPHKIMDKVPASLFEVSKYTPIISYDSAYVPILMNKSESGSAGDSTPAVLVKNTADQKIAVISFATNYSHEVTAALGFPLLIYNIFDYFLPPIITNTKLVPSYVFEVGETMIINTRGYHVEVSGKGMVEEFTEFPVQITLTVPDTYALIQRLLSNPNPVTEHFFVKISSLESDFFKSEKELRNPYFSTPEAAEDIDILIYLAAAMVALLFIEWWLKTKDQF